MRGLARLLLLIGVALTVSSVRVSAAPPVWRTYSTADGLAGNGVSAVALAPDGTVWVGSYGEGLSHFEGRGWVSYARGNGLADDWVTALATTGDGTLWVGTYEGLSRFDGIRWRTYTAANSALPGNLVTALARGQDGELWIGTYGAGVSRFDEESRQWRSFHRADSGLVSDWVTALALDSGGSLWVGTADRGVSRYDGKSWMTYDAAGSGLADGEVQTIAAGAGRQVWIGTGQGASVFDGQSWTTYRFSFERGYQRVNAVAADSGGSVWLGTNRGLLRFDDAGWTWLGMSDGLAHEYVTAIAAGRDSLWFGTLAGATVLGEDGPELPRPLPVVLVHGWHGPASDRVEDSQFRYLARWLERDGHRVFYATGITADQNLYENARRLARSIAGIKETTGAQAVTVIAHSMGGLVVRAYVESALYQGDVAQVAMLGTPQAGLHLWYGFLARELRAGSDEPSLRELTPEFMGLFNSVHRNVYGVPYMLIAGDARQRIEALQDLPASDGLVSVGTAHALSGDDVRRVVTDDVHGWTPATIRFGVSSYLWPADTYRAHLRNALRHGAEPGTSNAAPLPSPGETHTPYLEGRIASAQVIEHDVVVPPARRARFLLTWDRGDLTFELVAPSGRRIDPSETVESGDLDYMTLTGAEAFPFALYRVADPEPGGWRMVISAPDDLRGSAGYTAYAVLDDDLRLEVSTDGQTYGQGQDVTVTARLLGELRGVEVKAELVGPDGAITTFPLLDDGTHQDSLAGDGIYANRIRAPKVGGYYPLFVSASGAWRDLTIEKSRELIIMVSPETASLTGRYADYLEDPDGDGVYDQFVVEVGVDVLQRGEYALAVTLGDAQGRQVAHTVTPVSLSAGEQMVPVPLDVRLVRRPDSGGPYVVHRVALLDLSGAALLLDEAWDAHRTAAPP